MWNGFSKLSSMELFGLLCLWGGLCLGAWAALSFCLKDYVEWHDGSR